jgi:hypothetical protein
MRRSLLGAALLTALILPACAEPPNKEINQAQGAIDAALAAGAARYAEAEYTAATTTLQQANEAVAQRDFRLALNYALESREHAQNAARDAAENRARIRGEAERLMAEIAPLLAQASTRAADAERARLPRPTIGEARQSLAQVNAAVQKAGAAMKAEDYAAALPLLQGAKEQIETTLASLDAAVKSQSLRRRR